MTVEEKTCPRCGKRPAQPPHTCPYAEEIHGDRETLCECCEECEKQCAWDI